MEFIVDLKVTGEWGLNKIYSGVHWAQRKKQADHIHALVRSELMRQGIRPRIITGPVELWLWYNSRLDVTNHGYLTKLIEDALKGYVIEDDSRKYVKGVYQGFWDGEGIKVEIKEVL